ARMRGRVSASWVLDMAECRAICSHRRRAGRDDGGWALSRGLGFELRERVAGHGADVVGLDARAGERLPGGVLGRLPVVVWVPRERPGRPQARAAGPVR